MRIAALVAWSVWPALWATDYTFTKIVDNAPATSPGTSYRFMGPFLLNNKGAVAFTAQYTNARGDAVNGIYTGSGNGLSTMVEGDARVQATGFNDSGTVVYISAGNVWTAAAGAAPFQVFQFSTGNQLSTTALPEINNNGTVIYTLLNTVMARTGTAPAQTVISDTDLPRSNALIKPGIYGAAINNQGDVAVYASLVATGASCQCGLYIKGSALTLIAGFTSAVIPQLNDPGYVAFEGVYEGHSGVFIGNGGPVATAIDLTSQAVTLDHDNVSLNNKGKVAYWGGFGVSPKITGIFTGPDKVADRVIASGDPLFGSVVSTISQSLFAGHFFNDSGQVAFSYTLANGLSGIAVATPVVSSTPPPALSANGIVNGASFSADSAASPGAIVSLFGTNFTSQLAVPSNYPLPTSLNDVQVTFNGIAAPLYFVAPGQINVQVPFEVTGPSATVQVTNPAGQSESRTVAIGGQSPAIFTINQSGVGQGVVVFGNTATIVGPVTSGTDWRPAKAGDTITIYANGLGAVTPPIPNGFNSCDKSVCAPDLSNMTLRQTVVRPSVEIGGVKVPDNLILFSGLAPQFVGLYQINLTIPAGIRASDRAPIVIHQGSASSVPNVTIGLQ